MLLVHGLKIAEVPSPGGYYEFHSRRGPAPTYKDGAAICRDEEAYLEYEIVREQEFVDPRTGERQRIGFTREIEETLRLPLGAFRGMSEHINDQSRQITGLHKQVDKLQRELGENDRKLKTFAAWSLWKRLKFLFCGEKLFLS